MTTHLGKVLIVEDEKNLGQTLQEYLTQMGYECVWSSNIKDAKEHFGPFSPDVCLLDIGLPDGRGLDLAKEFKSSRKDFVLLFFSALNDPEIKVEALEIGADDYITKPFALKELMMRLQRIFKGRNERQNLPDEIRHGKLVIWPKRYEVMDAQKKIIPLSLKEWSILQFLYQNKDVVVGRDELIESIWGSDAYPSTRTVDNYIVKLRKWCETDPEQSIEIINVRGVGYKLIIKK